MSTKQFTIDDNSDRDVFKTFREYTLHKEQYYQIDRMFLVSGVNINFNVFLLDGQTLKRLVEASEKTPVLVDNRIETEQGDILISKSDLPLYESYLERFTKTYEFSDKDKQKMKAGLAKEQMKIVVKDVFDNQLSRETIMTVKNLVGDMISSVMGGQDVIFDLLTLKKHDYYSYLHSVNVGVLSIGLGAAINLDRPEIEKLGIGAILHDIGKTAVPVEILNHEGKMTNTEYKAFKNHVAEGIKILQPFKEIPQESLIAVMQHHEKLTGKGYPLGLSGDAIKLFGRITAIADCYDALTTPKPNKYPLKPFNALSVIAREKEDYDRNLLAAFVKMLGNMHKES